MAKQTFCVFYYFFESTENRQKTIAVERTFLCLLVHLLGARDTSTEIESLESVSLFVFHRKGQLGRFSLVVAISVRCVLSFIYVLSPSHSDLRKSKLIVISFKLRFDLHNN